MAKENWPHPRLDWFHVKARSHYDIQGTDLPACYLPGNSGKKQSNCGHSTLQKKEEEPRW